jgi:hypothetical protein
MSVTRRAQSNGPFPLTSVFEGFALLGNQNPFQFFRCIVKPLLGLVHCKLCFLYTLLVPTAGLLVLQIEGGSALLIGMSFALIDRLLLCVAFRLPLQGS